MFPDRLNCFSSLSPSRHLDVYPAAALVGAGARSLLDFVVYLEIE